LDEFVALLGGHGITGLADVRTIPRSRRHPHFSAEALAASLPQRGIEYRHFPDLGGLRTPRPDSSNAAWRNDGFRGYADYMQTASFGRALDDVIIWAGESPRLARDARNGASASGREGGTTRIVIMCAEAVWWRCHRQLIADALIARGIQVRHISSPATAPVHTLTDFARVDAGKVSYPGLV
jgi:uncharacterized protein (DUF488 family)